MIQLAALPPPSGVSPAARRRALARARDEDLAERLFTLARALRAARSEHPAIAGAAGLPLGEVLASPFALRMVAMAVDRGATTAHAELRRALPWPKAFAGEDGTVDPSHGSWDRGAMRLGKYQQFLQDEPLAVYQPSHVSKWGPHELLHRACGFFLRPGASRWELYLGARLNELLPVVTWYGPEQAMRLDEGAFDREAAGRTPAAPLDRARWLEDDTRTLRARALRAAPLLREGILHFERELEAIDREMLTGARVRVPHPFLDASQDALAYVAAHHARLERTSTALCQLVPHGERFSEIGAYRDAIEQRLDALLFSPFEVDLERAGRRRVGRWLWDVAGRAMLTGSAAARSLAADAGYDVARGLRGEVIDPAPWRARLVETLGDPKASLVLETGELETGAPSIAQLAEGVESCAARTLALAGDAIVPKLAWSEPLWDRAPLADRLARLCAKTDAKLGPLASFEASLCRVARRADDRVDRLCEPADRLPVDLGRALVVPSTAFEIGRFDRDVAALHADTAPRRGPQVYAIGNVRGEIVVVPVPEQVARVLESLRDPVPADELAAVLGGSRRARDGDVWVRGLVGAGVLGWTPRLSDAELAGRGPRAAARSGEPRPTGRPPG